MKKSKTYLSGLTAATVLAVAGLCNTAQAVPEVMTLDFHEYSYGIGGAFTILPMSDPSLINPYQVNGSKAVVDVGVMLGAAAPGEMLGFNTFCIEYNENFYNWGMYSYEITGAAMNGGLGVGDGAPGSDPVSAGTGYIYSQFAKGLLSSSQYDYNPSASGSVAAGALQKLIWFLEDETTTLASSSGGAIGAYALAMEAELIARFGSLANAKLSTAFDNSLNTAMTASGYGVFALNLGPNLYDSHQVQDQLIYRGGGFQQVPDGGATVVMLGLGLGVLGLAGRRFRK